ncbi:Nicotinate dehydrogenase FAD-subunit [bioreactor metagenome]|uniref:Nicotinate dehydrogenase FAD-subunit n=1 Tax=bioreactor metagenome TaxID=1076179 RepID=A0A645D669_9ZZZZ|nr:FAD binding domain-containing protein [Oscillibacter sp.]MEA4994813.1 FAD binding domain-containing protein [Oscillibacter sp.]
MRCLTPGTLEELADALSRLTEKSEIIAGGTDYVIRARRDGLEPDVLLYLGGIPALHELCLGERELRVGAMVTMRELAEGLEAVPEFRAIADAACDVGSPQIRNKATMVGNLCNASPAGDMLPVSWLYNAKMELLSGDGSTCLIPVSEFILGPQKNALEPGQAVLSVVMDRRPVEGCISAFKKIGSRERVSISREGIAACVRLEKGGAIAQARLTLGAVAATPLRIPEAEAMMEGRRLEDDELLADVTRVVARTIHENCRPANRQYKTEAARGLTADLFMQLKERI